jgi:lytic murein transglycosylase
MNVAMSAQMNAAAWLLVFAVLSLACGATVAAEPDLGRCLKQLSAEARKHGIRRDVFEKYTGAVQYDPKRALPDEAQAEFVWPIWEYLGALVDAQRSEDGQRLLREQEAALAKIEKRFGVDPATVVAIFGVETNFGVHKPKYPVVETFVNRACGFPAAGRRFKQEQKTHLFQALKMLQTGAVQETEFLGSRAGAFGMTQFMPHTYARDKTDIDGDGKADIINSVPDALGSTAHFLVRNGWTKGLPWAIAVTLPEGFNLDLAASGAENEQLLRSGRARGKVKTVAQWRKLGVVLADANITVAAAPAKSSPYSELSDKTPATLLLPEISQAATQPGSQAGTHAAPQGPAFLVTRNYAAFWRYNHSDAYALAVGVLSDVLRGHERKLAWSGGRTGLSRKQITELQQLLIKRGHDALRADGVPGALTRDAVRATQREWGWPETGYIDLELLQSLREASK